jgi:hypothetical protein
MIFFCDEFLTFFKKNWKKNSIKNLLFKILFAKRYSLKFVKNHHNCPQYEKVFKIFYFHILSIAIFGKIYLYGWSPFEEHHNFFKNYCLIGLIQNNKNTSIGFGSP